MSINSSGYGQQDKATFGAQFPRAGLAAVSTAQVQGVAVPNSQVTATANGNPSFPWLGFALALVALRVISHLRRE